MKEDTIEILKLILASDISKDAKEKIILHWMMPRLDVTGTVAYKPPIEKEEGRVGAIKRPSKQELDLKANPKLQEEYEAMTETLNNIPELNE